MVYVLPSVDKCHEQKHHGSRGMFDPLSNRQPLRKLRTGIQVRAEAGTVAMQMVPLQHTGSLLCRLCQPQSTCTASTLTGLFLRRAGEHAPAQPRHA